MKIFFTLFFISFLPYTIFAQLENHTWFLGDDNGNNAGIRFNFDSNIPEQYNNVRYPLSLIENNIIICNPENGNVIFYSDGSTVVDGTHNPMPNGQNLKGSNSSMAGTNVVFEPVNCNRYLLFTTPAIEENIPKKIYYSIIDLNLPGNGSIDNPLGDIDENFKNIDITPNDAIITEGLLSIKKNSNSKESWLFFGDKKNNLIYTLNIDKSGLNIHKTYDIKTLFPSLPAEGFSTLKMDFQSLDQERGIIVFAPGFSTTNASYPIGYFIFNKISGEINLNSYVEIANNTNFVYGITFSSDGSKLYYSDYVQKNLTQFDFSSTTSTIVGLSNHSGRSGGLETGPDSKVYWLNIYANFGNSSGTRSISIIDSPNLPGIACDFQLNAYDIGSSPNTMLSGTFPQIGTLPNSPSVEILASQACGENGSAIVNTGEFTPPFRFLWDNGETTQSATNLSSGSHTVTITDGQGCEEIRSLEIAEEVLFELSNISLSSQSPSSCLLNNGTIEISADGILAGENYTLSFENKITGSQNNINVSAIEAGVLAITNFSEGIYHNFVLKKPDSTCEFPLEDTITLTAPNTPNKPEAIFSEKSCLGNPLVLSASNVNANLMWTGPNGFRDSGMVVIVSPNTTVVMEGTYYVNAFDGDCKSLTDSITVSFNTPDIDLGVDRLICRGEEINLNVAENFSTYLWSDGSENNSLVINETGKYAVTVTNSENCKDSSEINVEVLDYPEIILPNVINLDYGDSIIIIPNVTPTNDWNYSWSPSVGLSCLTCANPTLKINEDQMYSLIVSNRNNCNSEISFSVNVAPRPGVYIPNNFSPNQDGINDIFSILSTSTAIKSILYFKIFDRWGELVFEKNNFKISDANSNGWDGTFNNKKLNPGVFTYIAEIEFIDGQIEVYSNDITLLR